MPGRLHSCSLLPGQREKNIVFSLFIVGSQELNLWVILKALVVFQYLQLKTWRKRSASFDVGFEALRGMHTWSLYSSYNLDFFSFLFFPFPSSIFFLYLVLLMLVVSFDLCHCIVVHSVSVRYLCLHPLALFVAHGPHCLSFTCSSISLFYLPHFCFLMYLSLAHFPIDHIHLHYFERLQKS